MIPERIYTRPNVVPRHYCSHCGTQLHDDKDTRWKFCPMCGKEIEWHMAKEVNLREVKCQECKTMLVYWKNGTLVADPSFCGAPICRECIMKHCRQTECLSCALGNFGNCKWKYLKALAIATEVEL